MNVQYLLLARYRAIADKNNYIVWEFVGTSESFTDAMAHLATLRLLGIEIDEDIVSYANARLLDADILKIEADEVFDAYGAGNANVLPVMLLSGDGENSTYIDEILRVFPVTSLEIDVIAETETQGVSQVFQSLRLGLTNLEIIGNIDAGVKALKVIVIHADDVMIKRETSDVKGYAFRAAQLNADIEGKTYSDTKAYSLRLVPVPTEKIEIKNYTIDTIRLLDVLSMQGQDEIELFSSSDGHLFFATPMNSSTNGHIEGASTLRYYLVTVISGVNENETETVAGIDTMEAKVCEVDEESKTETTANMNIWALPVVWGDTLLLHQAASATQTDNTLEVI